MKSGIELIFDERNEQIEKHGRTLESDFRQNNQRQLLDAAYMLLSKEYSEIDPTYYRPMYWSKRVCDHMLDKSYKDRLIMAGALIAAEIDRFNYQP